MKKTIFVSIVIALAVLGSGLPVFAQPLSVDEARTVATNWIELIIQKKGDWGGSNTAQIDEILEFKRGERVLGFFCRVHPSGFIVVSLFKELAPIKAYSPSTDLNPDSNESLADLIKIGMERILDEIERQVGSLKLAQSQSFANILEINYRQSWEELEKETETFKTELQTKTLLKNYQEGEIMLTSAWHQNPPYNDECPKMNCHNSNGRALVGCIAIAGAQVMRYYNWPPYNDYDWPNMLDSVETTSQQVNIDAVAKLCHDVGVEAGMDYGCDESGAYFASVPGPDLLDAFEDHFRFSNDADNLYRSKYTASKWWDKIKTLLNGNCPIPYAIPNHAIVVDGWQEIGTTPIRNYHINYGWGLTGTCQDGCNTWYTLDAIYGGKPDDEIMIANLYPSNSLHGEVSGLYITWPFPYRYFNRDATGSMAIFNPGHYLQFLPGITVTATDNPGIQIIGTTDLETRLFTRGDKLRGIRIYNCSMFINKNGSIKFH